MLAVKEKSDTNPASRLGRLFDPGGERSLDDAVTTVVGGLALRGSARCPVCGGTLMSAAEPDAVESPPAECGGCGSSLE